ncbi:MAG: hypothetical protein IKN55_11095, partial [Oscillospiraceae bacterium]|nr:hypothetical protein [Oscillospiraceae bacterium]
MSNDYTNLYSAPDTSPEPDAAPKPFTLDSSQVNVSAPPAGAVPPQRPLPPRETYIPRPAPPAPMPQKEKKPFSPIPLLLIAGVAFLFLGGVLFLTNTWDVMPNMGRAVTLLSASVLAFGANLLAERVFRLEKTGLAFFILGCIFLPLSIGGIGVFSLFGEWFSYSGGGSMLLWACIFLGVALPTFYGQFRYKNTPLAWMSFAGFSAAWTFLARFASAEGLKPFGADEVTGWIVTFSLWVAFAVGFSFLTEWLLQKKPGTPLAKASLFVLYPLLLFYTFYLWFLVTESDAAALILWLILAVLFCNKRFGSGTLHGGVFGSILALIGAAVAINGLLPQEEDLSISDMGFAPFWFVPGFVGLVLMAVRFAKQEALSKTYGVTGLVIIAVTLPIGILATLFDTDYIPFLFALFIMCTVFIAIEKKGKLPKDIAFMAVHLGLVFLTVVLNAQEFHLLYVLLLVIAALLLLGEGFLAKRIWPVMTAVAACAGLLIVRLPFLAGNDKLTNVLLMWAYAAGFLTTVIYAHVVRRPLLEKSGAWTLISFMTIALMLTLNLFFEDMELVVWTLSTAFATLLYLLEAAVFTGHERTRGTRPFLEILTGFLGIGAVITFVDEREITYGWGFLLLFLLAVFVFVYTRRKVNA